tara:strand:- start:116 stop:1201 length:1086 start_codon:yes stop_codon:yes gene_type:complete
MSSLKANYTYINGVKTNFNYRLEVKLPTGLVRLTLPDTKNNKRLAKLLQTRANEIETRARLFPNDKDWEIELHKAVGLEYKLAEKVAIPTILKAFKSMLSEKKSLKEVNQKTISIYEYAIGYLIKAIGNKKLSNITSGDKIKLLDTFDKSGLGASSINIYSRNIISFFNWCFKNKLIAELPFYLKQIQVDQSEKTWIKPDEFELICSHMDRIPRAYAIVSYATGMRKCELSSDPDDKHYGGLYHTIERVDNVWQLKIRGKGGKTRLGILPDELKGTYDLMVANRINPTTINKKFKQASESAGFKNLHFHHLRHSYGSNLTTQKKDPHFIMVSMGHSNLSTTTGYVNDRNLAWDRLISDISA